MKNNLTGKRFGKLTAISPTDKRNHLGCIMWKTKCDCGGTKEAGSHELKQGHIKSCGCLIHELSNEQKVTHAQARRNHQTREYRTWISIKSRCYTKSCTGYENYGGRGIEVCDRWIHSFENFYYDMGDKPLGSSIERINNNGDYTPTNCRWSLYHSEQMLNRRPSSEWRNS